MQKVRTSIVLVSSNEKTFLHFLSFFNRVIHLHFEARFCLLLHTHPQSTNAKDVSPYCIDFLQFCSNYKKKKEKKSFLLLDQQLNKRICEFSSLKARLKTQFI